MKIILLFKNKIKNKNSKDKIRIFRLGAFFVAMHGAQHMNTLKPMASPSNNSQLKKFKTQLISLQIRKVGYLKTLNDELIR